jgi:hypothetical protein
MAIGTIACHRLVIDIAYLHSTWVDLATTCIVLCSSGLSCIALCCILTHYYSFWTWRFFAMAIAPNGSSLHWQSFPSHHHFPISKSLKPNETLCWSTSWSISMSSHRCPLHSPWDQPDYLSWYLDRCQPTHYLSMTLVQIMESICMWSFCPCAHSPGPGHQGHNLCWCGPPMFK